MDDRRQVGVVIVQPMHQQSVHQSGIAQRHCGGLANNGRYAVAIQQIQRVQRGVRKIVSA